ncbi:MAG: ABC transporter permease [Candidatus Korarchaeota archaeon]|nr:ABC transporter permease [Candidatus Korarchaeota archaeon]
MRLKVVRRLEINKGLLLTVRVLSVAAALLAASLVFMAYGLDPLDVYRSIFSNAFATRIGLTESVVRMIPLLLVSSGLALVFRTGFWNIGAEGQLLAGAMAAYLVAVNFTTTPTALLIPALFLAGFVAGALWGILPALLKAKLNVNEVISTLMLYYVLYWVFQHLIHGPWKAREKVGQLTYGGFAHTEVLPENSHLPVIDGTRIHWPTLLVAVAASVVAYFLLTRTPWGYEMRVVGDNPDAARAAGISYLKAVTLAMVVSGGLAGLAGVGELCGIQKRFTPEFLSGYGFSGIITAWLGGTNPISLLITNFLYGGLLVGGEYIMITYRLPIGVVDIFNGIILFFVLAGDFFVRYELRRG